MKYEWNIPPPAIEEGAIYWVQEDVNISLFRIRFIEEILCGEDASGVAQAEKGKSAEQ